MTLDFIDLRNGGIELCEGQGSSPVESEIMLKDNYFGKVEHCLTKSSSLTVQVKRKGNYCLTL